MSSLPGYTLEDYVSWCWDLVVDDNSGVNTSLHIAEALGMSTRVRPRITSAQFAPLLALYEPYREDVERLLEDFDEETQSWRGYAGSCFDFIPGSVNDAAYPLVLELRGISPANTAYVGTAVPETNKEISSTDDGSIVVYVDLPCELKVHQELTPNRILENLRKELEKAIVVTSFSLGSSHVTDYSYLIKGHLEELKRRQLINEFEVVQPTFVATSWKPVYVEKRGYIAQYIDDNGSVRREQGARPSSLRRLRTRLRKSFSNPTILVDFTFQPVQPCVTVQVDTSINFRSHHDDR